MANKCRHCDTDNSNKAKFCMCCGEELFQNYCTNCECEKKTKNVPLNPSAMFCDQCGARTSLSFLHQEDAARELAQYELENRSMIKDPTFIAAVEAALERGEVSTSALQRRLRIGYARAGRIIDEMEQQHIIGPPDGTKPRRLIITREHWLYMQASRGKQ